MAKMMYMLVALVAVLGSVNCYPTSVPAEACTSMYPELHNVSAQTADPPFSLTLSTATYALGTEYTVTLMNTTTTITAGARTDQEAFAEGLFVQARKAVGCGAANNVPQGQFRVVDTSLLTTMKCTNNNDAVHHTSSDHKHTSTFRWKTTQDVGPIYFRATVVWHRELIWTDVFSTIIQGPTPDNAASICREVRASTTTAAPVPTTVSAATSLPYSLTSLAIATFILALF